jgi:Restriction endonuclease
MLFVVAFGALAVGGLLIVLMARYAPHPNATLNAVARALPGGKAIPYEEFRALIIDLLEALKLEIVIEHGEANEVDIIARSNEAVTGGRFLVHGVWQAPGDVIDQPYVVRLADQVRSDGRLSKGILITPYTILSDGLGNLETPIELIDGRKLRALVEQHLDAKRLDHLAQYRGFGL